MNKQPHIYTMPEGFLTDPSIGVKWKLYAIINGFWISGKPVYGANKFFSDKLGVSERQIRNGLAQLEKDGYILRTIKGHNRTIQPGGYIIEAEVRVPLGGSESSAAAEVRVPPIAVSISDNLILGGAVAPRENVMEVSDEKPVKPKADTSYLQVFELWGDYPLNWKRNRTEIDAAKNLLVETTIDEMRRVLKIYERFKGYEFCPAIHKPSDLDRKWDNLLDFRDKHV